MVGVSGTPGTVSTRVAPHEIRGGPPAQAYAVYSARHDQIPPSTSTSYIHAHHYPIRVHFVSNVSRCLSSDQQHGSFHCLCLLSPYGDDKSIKQQYIERKRSESGFLMKVRESASDTTDTAFSGTTANKGNYRNCSRRSESFVSHSHIGYYHGSVGVTAR